MSILQQALESLKYNGKDNVVVEQEVGMLMRLAPTKLTVVVPARAGEIHYEDINGVLTESILTEETAVGKTTTVPKFGITVKIGDNKLDALVLGNAIDALAMQQGVGNKVVVTIRETTLTEAYTSKHVDPITKLPIVHAVGSKFYDIISVAGIRDTKVYTVAE